MSNKIIKVPNGEAYGSRTYGDKSVPKNRWRNKTSDLKRESTTRLIILINKGQSGDKLARVEKKPNEKEIEQIVDANKVNKSPKIVQFAYHRGRLTDFRKELELLLKSGNKRKIELYQETIKKQIKEVEKTMRELFDDIKRESSDDNG